MKKAAVITDDKFKEAGSHFFVPVDVSRHANLLFSRHHFGGTCIPPAGILTDILGYPVVCFVMNSDLISECFWFPRLSLSRWCPPYLLWPRGVLLQTLSRNWSGGEWGGGLCVLGGPNIVWTVFIWVIDTDTGWFKFKYSYVVLPNIACAKLLFQSRFSACENSMHFPSEHKKMGMRKDAWIIPI